MRCFFDFRMVVIGVGYYFVLRFVGWEVYHVVSGH